MQPTHRTSRGRSGRRRSHDALKPQSFTIDPVMGSTKRHHRAAADSGYVRPGLTIRVPKLGIGDKD